MSIPSTNYYKSKELGEKLGWSSDKIREHAEEGTKSDIKELTRQLVDAFNSHGSQDLVVEAMVEGITSSHKFLQSEFMAGVVCMLGKYSKLPENHFDGRNAHYKEICDRMYRAAHDPDCKPKWEG
jgi:hypothetical protein